MVEAEDVEGAEGAVAMAQGGEGGFNKTEGILHLSGKACYLARRWQMVCTILRSRLLLTCRNS